MWPLQAFSPPSTPSFFVLSLLSTPVPWLSALIQFSLYMYLFRFQLLFSYPDIVGPFSLRFYFEFSLSIRINQRTHFKAWKDKQPKNVKSHNCFIFRIQIYVSIPHPHRGGGGTSWGGRRAAAAPACQAELLTALFMFQKLNGECQDIIQDADGVATQRLLPSSLENIGKFFVMKRVQRCPSFGGKDGSVSHLELAESVWEDVCTFSAQPSRW